MTAANNMAESYRVGLQLEAARETMSGRWSRVWGLPDGVPAELPTASVPDERTTCG